MLAPGNQGNRAALVPGCDPIAAAEEEIRRYLLAHRASEIRARAAAPAKGHPVLCFLAIYAGLALIVVVMLWAKSRIECDPMFTDRGLTAACRAWGQDPGKLAVSDGAISLPGQ